MPTQEILEGNKLLTATTVGKTFKSRSRFNRIALYGGLSSGSWVNEEYSATISRLFISQDFEHKILEVEVIENCKDQSCDWDPGRLVRSGNRYVMTVNSAEASRRLIITPINPNRLHVRVITRFRDSEKLSSWEYYFFRAESVINP